MERSVILVSGRVQKVGYRSKVMALDRFATALKVKNSLIDVAAVEVERHDATGEFGAFSKLVDELETDSRLDRSAELLKELIDVTRDGFCRMDGGFRGLGDKMDRMLDKQDIMIDKQDQMLDKQDETIAAIKGIDFKMDQMLDKQDQMLDKQDQMLDKQDETTGEVRGLRSDMKGSFDMRLERIETALKEKGII